MKYRLLIRAPFVSFVEWESLSANLLKHDLKQHGMISASPLTSQEDSGTEGKFFLNYKKGWHENVTELSGFIVVVGTQVKERFAAGLFPELKGSEERTVTLHSLDDAIATATTLGQLSDGSGIAFLKIGRFFLHKERMNK